MSTLDKEEGAPATEAPSPKDVRVTSPLEHPPSSTRGHYTPDVPGLKGGRWAKVPVQSLELDSKPLERLLCAYSGHAGGQTRIAIVSDSRIAVECGWFYTSKATGARHPHRRRLWSYRKELIDLGYMLPAGRRCIEGKWIDAFVVAPYSTEHIETANTWRIQTHVSEIGSKQVHRFETPGAPLSTPPGALLSGAHTEVLQNSLQKERSSASSPLRGSPPRKSYTPKREREYESTDVIEDRRRRTLKALEIERLKEQERTEEKTPTTAG